MVLIYMALKQPHKKTERKDLRCGFWVSPQQNHVSNIPFVKEPCVSAVIPKIIK